MMSFRERLEKLHSILNDGHPENRHHKITFDNTQICWGCRCGLLGYLDGAHLSMMHVSHLDLSVYGIPPCLTDDEYNNKHNYMTKNRLSEILVNGFNEEYPPERKHPSVNISTLLCSRCDSRLNKPCLTDEEYVIKKLLE